MKTELTLAFVVVYALAFATATVVWNLVRRPRIARTAAEYAIRRLVEDIAASFIPGENGRVLIPAVCLGGPLDGYEFDASAEHQTAILNGNRYDFAARSTRNGRWVFRFAAGQHAAA